MTSFYYLPRLIIVFIAIGIVFGCSEENIVVSDTPITFSSASEIAALNSSSMVNAIQYSNTFSNLSKLYDFEVCVTKVLQEQTLDSTTVVLKVFSKGDSTSVLNMNFSTRFLSDSVFTNHVRSYSTDVNTTTDVLDNDYGDLIVADFNFDCKDDFAVKMDEGGNGGPVYHYYLQNSNGSGFTSDSFLNTEVLFFPSEINNRTNTLTTVVHASAVDQCKRVFRYSSKSKEYILISKTFVPYSY